MRYEVRIDVLQQDANKDMQDEIVEWWKIHSTSIARMTRWAWMRICVRIGVSDLC